ncbi:hypothetical protein L9F63_003736, partial [Diploptera punctata]
YLVQIRFMHLFFLLDLFANIYSTLAMYTYNLERGPYEARATPGKCEQFYINAHFYTEEYYPDLIVCENGDSADEKRKLFCANVQAAFERSPRKSLRRASRELQIPKSTLQRIVHKRLKLHAYKVQLVQRLEPNDMPKRVEFANTMLDRLGADPDFMTKIFFSDEATFHLSASPKMNVWCSLSHNVIGPFFFAEKTVRVRTTLDNISLAVGLRIIEAIENIPEDILQRTWQEIVHRFDIVTVTAGAHIEMNLKMFWLLSFALLLSADWMLAFLRLVGVLLLDTALFSQLFEPLSWSATMERVGSVGIHSFLAKDEGSLLLDSVTEDYLTGERHQENIFAEYANLYGVDLCFYRDMYRGCPYPEAWPTSSFLCLLGFPRSLIL